MEENNMQSPKKVICCKLKDTEKLMASQSGGAFTAIATAFLKCGGIVYGCEMDNSNQAVYKRIDHIEKLEEIKRTGKVVHKKLGECKARVIDDRMVELESKTKKIKCDLRVMLKNQLIE